MKANIPVAIIIGLAGGVGAALTAELLSMGFCVAGTVRDKREADIVREMSPSVRVAIADLADSSGVRSALGDLLDQAGDNLAAVVVCAGISPPGPLEIVELDAVRQAFEINVISNLAVFQASMPCLRRSKGRFVMVSSNAGKVAFPFLGPYVISKHALEGMADVMRQEAAHWGVDVVLVQPGGIRTAMIAGTIAAIEGQIAGFDTDQHSLYGALYGRLLGIAKAGARDGMEPIIVAKTICRAIETKVPRTRYVIGTDALATIRMRRRSSDRTMDRMFHKAYASDTGSLSEANRSAEDRRARPLSTESEDAS